MSKIKNSILNLIDKDKDLNVKKESELFLINEAKNNKEKFNKLFKIVIKNYKDDLDLEYYTGRFSLSTLLNLISLHERITLLSNLPKYLLKNNDGLEDIALKPNKNRYDYALLLFKYIYYRKELEKIINEKLMDELEFRYNLELYPHWTLSSYINDLFSYVYNIKSIYKSTIFYEYYNKYKYILEDIIKTKTSSKELLDTCIYIEPDILKILNLNNRDFEYFLYKTTTLRVVNDFNTFSNKTLEIYKYFLIATINKSKLLDLLNKVINDITNIKCKNFFKILGILFVNDWSSLV